jgi:hypothetical protein
MISIHNNISLSQNDKFYSNYSESAMGEREKEIYVGLYRCNLNNKRERILELFSDSIPI